MRTRNIAVAAIAAMLALPVASASAQQSAAPRNVLSLQPLNAMMTAYSAEYERQTGKAVSFGVGGTYWAPGEGVNEVTYTSGDVKLRYYPTGAALTGFSFGASAGYANISGQSSTGVEESAGAPTFGILLEYQWLLGTNRRFALALGAGAKMVFIDEAEFSSEDFIARYPTFRVSIGYAF